MRMRCWRGMKALHQFKERWMNLTLIGLIAKRIYFVGNLWAAVGLFIIIASNIILIFNFEISFWVIPINPRDNVLTAFLLLVPVVLIVCSVFLKRLIRKKSTK